MPVLRKIDASIYFYDINSQVELRQKINMPQKENLTEVPLAGNMTGMNF
jgi:hypothetical protein